MTTNEDTSRRMARIRSHDTTPELVLRRSLWALGVRYRLRSTLPGKPDLVVPGARLAVFVDGCFWHGCPEHYVRPRNNARFWRQKLERNVARRKSVKEQLAQLGWSVVELWECDVKKGASIPSKLLERTTSAPSERTLQVDGNLPVEFSRTRITIKSERRP